jgi:hypothetical protein
MDAFLTQFSRAGPMSVEHAVWRQMNKLPFPMSPSDYEQAIVRLASTGLVIDVRKCHAVFEGYGCSVVAGKLSLADYARSYSTCLRGFNDILYEETSREKCLSAVALPQSCSDYEHCFESRIEKRSVLAIPTMLLVSVIGSLVFLLILIPTIIALSTRETAWDRSVRQLERLRGATILKPTACQEVQYYWGTCGPPGSKSSQFCPWGGRVVSKDACLAPKNIGFLSLQCGLKNVPYSSIPFSRNETTEADQLEEPTKRRGLQCQSLCILDKPDKCILSQ